MPAPSMPAPSTPAPIAIRPAGPADAATAAFLLNEAAGGIPLAMWEAAAEPSRNPWAIGAARMEERMARATVRMLDAPDPATGAPAPAAFLMGYPIPAPEPVPADAPEPFVPPLELEALSAPSWYINALAALPGARGRGHGARLLAAAEAEARAAGLDALSLIASDANAGAIRLYERTGFAVVASRPQRPVAGWTPKGRDWLLMVRRGLG